MVTKEQIKIISKIIDRAENDGAKNYDRLSMIWVLGKATEQFDLRLEDMLNADDFNFYHDYVQLPMHFDMRNGIFDGRFLPRFEKLKKQLNLNNSKSYQFGIYSDTRTVNNWVTCYVILDAVRYKVSAKVFDEGSIYGIDDGRISKLSVICESDGKEIINYDRGWDVYPRDSKQLSMLKKLIKELNDLPITGRK